MHIYICKYIYTYLYIYICIYIYTRISGRYAPFIIGPADGGPSVVAWLRPCWGLCPYPNRPNICKCKIKKK